MGMTDERAHATLPKLKVGIDCDVTTFATDVACLRRYNRTHNTNFTPNDIVDYNFRTGPLCIPRGEFDCLFGATWIEDWPRIPVLASRGTLYKTAQNFAVTFTSDRPAYLKLPLVLALRQAYPKYGLGPEINADLLKFDLVFNDAPYAIDRVLAGGGKVVKIKAAFNGGNKPDTREGVLVVPNLETGLRLANAAVDVIRLMKRNEDPPTIGELWETMKALSIELQPINRKGLLRVAPEKRLCVG
jgi:hypothetical protein